VLLGYSSLQQLEYAVAVHVPLSGGVTEWRDFGLIRLDDGVPASAEMCHFGGPTGLNDDLHGRPTLLHHVGHGDKVAHPCSGPGDVCDTNLLTARTAVAPFGMPQPSIIGAYGVIRPGDSGSGAIDDRGEAVGVMNAIGPGVFSPSNIGPVFVYRLGPMIEDARVLLGLDELVLQTAG
jgi:hypothetical protein